MDRYEWMTPDQVARELKTTYFTVLRWIRKEGLPAYRVGRQYRIRRGELTAWATARPGPTTEVVPSNGKEVS